MSRHTPGPWVAQHDGEEWGIFREDTCHFVTTVTGVIGTEANARLIAAAPDLLEALERVQSYFSNALQHREPYFAVEEQIRAAIAKATGGDR